MAPGAWEHSREQMLLHQKASVAAIGIGKQQEASALSAIAGAVAAELPVAVPPREMTELTLLAGAAAAVVVVAAAEVH